MPGTAVGNDSGTQQIQTIDSTDLGLGAYLSAFWSEVRLAAMRKRTTRHTRWLWLTVILIMVLPITTHAQDRMAASGSASEHRFFDRTNIGLTAMESAALLADGYYTQKGLHDYPEFFKEADPIARPFVTRGWSGQIAGGVVFVTADVGLRYWMHRKRHHLAERLLPLVLTTYGLVGAIHGARELHRAGREYRRE